jgi:fluoroacetyl-CoA thioesterase
MKRSSVRRAKPKSKAKAKSKSKRASRFRGHAENKSTASLGNLPRFQKNLRGSIERTVEFQWTIAAYNPDHPAIFSTPSMIALMEVAAAKAIQEHLPPGTISVGTRIEVDHLKAVPQGTLVRADARLLGDDGRFLAFEVEAHAKDLLIGRGKVYRAIVTLKTPDSIARK